MNIKEFKSHLNYTNQSKIIASNNKNLNPEDRIEREVEVAHREEDQSERYRLNQLSGSKNLQLIKSTKSSWNGRNKRKNSKSGKLLRNPANQSNHDNLEWMKNIQQRMSKVEVAHILHKY